MLKNELNAIQVIRDGELRESIMTGNEPELHTYRKFSAMCRARWNMYDKIGYG